MNILTCTEWKATERNSVVIPKAEKLDDLRSKNDEKGNWSVN